MILLILPERVYISGRVCGGCSAGVVPRGLRGAVREARYSPSRGLMMTDLDNLKTINDTYGYDWGDNYLRQRRGPSTKRPPRSSPRWNARKPSGKKPGLKKQKVSPSVLASCRYRGRFFCLSLLNEADEEGAEHGGEDTGHGDGQAAHGTFDLTHLQSLLVPTAWAEVPMPTPLRWGR